MRTNITSSIQEYCKKINSALTYTDVVSLLITCILLGALVVWIALIEQSNYKPIIYINNTTQRRKGDEYSETSSAASNQNNSAQSALPFGSIKGKTYTFSWCMGQGKIAPKNKIYFSSVEEARSKGRTLSKMCTK